jgi:Protein of unknown function (DUF3300)
MMNWQKRSLVVSLSCSLAIAGPQAGGMSAAAQSAASPPAAVAQPQRGQRFDAEQLDQLVAPIALYPDEMVTQILAASAYPVEVVEAERWMQEHSSLHGAALAQEVDKQSWDPSVKALTQFPPVLDNMNKNLAWTSALGDAYVNQQPDVLDAVQAMRRRAQAAGNLKSTPQETVTTAGQTIVIQPADAQTVYVPQYDPWLVYGTPLAAYPGWAPIAGLYVDEPGIWYGLGLGIGLFAAFGWGWHHWGADWHDHRLMHDHAAYVPHSTAFGFHGGESGFHGGESGFHGGALGFHGGGLSRPDVLRGSGAPRGLHSGAFSGVNHGGIVQSHSFHGQSSLGGGFHGGGLAAGGFHGGGFHGGAGGFHGGGGGFHGGGGGFHGGGGHR